MRVKNVLGLLLIVQQLECAFGHQIGDIALQKFVQCLSSTCGPNDFIGRHGGEEFVICLPNKDYKQSLAIAECMRKSVEDLCIDLPNEKKIIKLTASFGVSSSMIGNKENINSLILHADRAMYKAKSNGRNRVCGECENRKSTN